MANKTENTAKDAEQEKTVTISEAQLKAMLADITLMKEKLASEERQRGISDNKKLEAEKTIRRIEEMNAKAMELVEYHAEMGSIRSNKNIEVSVNGKQYVVPRGKTVKIPRCVAEVLDNAQNQRNIAYGTLEEKADELKNSEWQFDSGYVTGEA